MAKAAASLDVLSGGRFELGLGAGAVPHQIARMGGPDSPAESVDALKEAIEVIRRMWSGARSVSFEGRCYRLHRDRTGSAVLERVRRDFESGLASGEVRGTPTLFIDGVAHRGGYDAAARGHALS